MLSTEQMVSSFRLQWFMVVPCLFCSLEPCIVSKHFFGAVLLTINDDKWLRISHTNGRSMINT